LEPLLVHYPKPEIEAKFNLIVDYILFIRKSKEQLFQNSTNELISGVFEELVDMMVYELYFEKHMKEKELDVLQFVNFPDISKMDSFEEKRDAIQKIYFWLKEKDNPIRNRILVSSTRSPNIIKRINETTH
jgi:adenine-specific DNA-methyltransferase